MMTEAPSDHERHLASLFAGVYREEIDGLTAIMIRRGRDKSLCEALGILSVASTEFGKACVAAANGLEPEMAKAACAALAYTMSAALNILSHDFAPTQAPAGPGIETWVKEVLDGKDE